MAELAPGTRFDGGPDEGTRGPRSCWSRPTALELPAAPDEGSSPAGGPSMLPSGPEQQTVEQQHPGARP